MNTLEEVNAFTRSLSRDQIKFLLVDYCGFTLGDDDDLESLQDCLAGLIKTGALRQNVRSEVYSAFNRAPVGK